MIKRFDSSEGKVFKYMFTNDTCVAEVILYRYESFYKRTVICCSTMSGCGQLWYVQKEMKEHNKKI